ncbi:MAG TPA: alginate lyase family protein [Pyrinomonadaceae bacterium]|nr:alginate lyase family protein [Pyrinomonadaceae bacterium]
MNIAKLKPILRGDISAAKGALEVVRRINSGLLRRRERRQLAQLNRQPARLRPEFARLSPAELLNHFKARQSPTFFPGFAEFDSTARLQNELFDEGTAKLIGNATRIANDHYWPLLGFGEKCFGAGEIDWNLDPLSGTDWPLTYHGDINLFRGDGSDARVLWELNRLAHLITLGRAYAVTKDEKFCAEFLRQVRSWRSQNPIARGVNWSCAMEVALRAMNLLAAFTLFLPSPQVNEDALAELLMMFDQHGAHIRRNLEYSHIATSNHYMCDVAGLLWLGITLPELVEARAWREFGLRELLNEIDKQILPDGADSESSTGYHRLKLELLLYSFVLCHVNGIEIDKKYWQKLREMAEYIRAYLRPDGRAPLIGDSDSGQVLPILKRAGDDHEYVLGIAATVFREPRFKMKEKAPEEVLWLLGEQGVRDYGSLDIARAAESRGFTHADVYVLRHQDLYLLFNASGCGLKGRGSHGHNDALSIDVSAGGTAFIGDPGSFVYSADLHERHLFRSTAYHSTVQIDGVEQNTIDEQTPFVIGDEAHPRVLVWETNAEFDYAVAEHDGYQRLAQPVTHRRSVRFDKRNGFWLVEDEFTGAGLHELTTRFHFNAGLEVRAHNGNSALARDPNSGARLLIRPLNLAQPPQFEEQFTSRDYGAKEGSLTACWAMETTMPCKFRWLLVPIRSGDDERERLALVKQSISSL